MYAVIKTGGKQYRVSEGDVGRIEALGAEPGIEVEFDGDPQGFLPCRIEMAKDKLELINEKG